MRTFFYSDPHFGHEAIIRYCSRPFKDVAEMDRALISNWNETVGPADEVWLLGDVFFCQAKEAHRILDQLNGSIHLVLGNHDKVIKHDNTLIKRFASVTDGIKEIDRHVDGEKVRLVLCHYPILSWNKAYRGSLQLHGHSHGAIPHDPRYRRHDVGVDVWNYHPVSLDEVGRKLLKIPAADARGR